MKYNHPTSQVYFRRNVVIFASRLFSISINLKHFKLNNMCEQILTACVEVELVHLLKVDIRRPKTVKSVADPS